MHQGCIEVRLGHNEAVGERITEMSIKLYWAKIDFLGHRKRFFYLIFEFS